MKNVFSRGLLFLVAALLSCTASDIKKAVDCSTSDLALSLVSKTDVSGCKATDGKIVVAGASGVAPFTYNINGGAFQASAEFINLGSGSYSLSVKDANGCVKSLDVSINASNTTLNAAVVTVKNSQCFSPNGSIVVNASGGTPPYSYQFGTASFSGSNSIGNLKEGTYNVVVKDAADCLKSVGAVVGRDNTGIKYSTQVQPIFETSCNLGGCHGSGTGPRDWTVFSNVVNQKDRIKLRTGNRSMPTPGSGVPALTQSQIDLIACWVDDGAPNN